MKMSFPIIILSYHHPPVLPSFHPTTCIDDFVPSSSTPSQPLPASPPSCQPVGTPAPPILPHILPVPSRKSSKVTHKPSHLTDYICTSVSVVPKAPSCDMHIQEPQFYHQAATHRLLTLIRLGTLYLFHLIKRLSLPNGFTK